MAIPQHQVIERNGQRIYVRDEEGGNRRMLHVWRYESCLERMKLAQAENRLLEAFASLNKQLTDYKNGPDPMMAAWFEECFERCSYAYDEVTGGGEIEEFGFTDEIEEFGV